MLHNSAVSADLGRLIDAAIKRYERSISVGAARYYRLVRIREFLRTHGYPRTFLEKCALSLVPFIFQEANYDDINWSDQHGDLGHLSALFDIDARIMNEGRPRSMLNPEAFYAYCNESRQIIDEHKR